MTLTDQTRRIQTIVGVPADGAYGPNTATAILAKLGDVPAQSFDRAAFLARYVNHDAPAIDDGDRALAASRLGVTYKHIRAIEKVESNGVSFDNSGRPIILPEPHIFFRLTAGRFGTTPFSYAKWGARPYPGSYDARWSLLADMAERDEASALQSASWGLFQVMGFHYAACGYATPQAFAAGMVADEAHHLAAMVEFILSEHLDDELRACRAGDPDSCAAFCRGYNGAGFRKNNYHVKLASALR